MATYILLTRIDASVLEDRGAYVALNEAVVQRLEHEGVPVTWKANYAVSGPYDYLDIFEAPDNEVASRVALIVRTTGHAAVTEIWSATSWDGFKKLLHDGEANAEASRGSRQSTDPVDEATRESFPASDPPAWTGTSAT